MTTARSAFWTRTAFAGPIAIIVAALVMLGMPLWLPGGSAGIDNIVFPLILLPVIWAALFFHACLDAKLWRVAVVAIGLAALHGALIATHFSTTAPATQEARP